MAWEFSLREIQMRVKTQLGFEISKVHQDFDTMVEVLSLAFGKKKTGSEGVPTNVVVPQTEDELAACLRQMNGG